MKTHATQRSLKLLRRNGWTCHIVEKWIPPRGKMKFGVRIDAFGIGDILACRPEMEGTREPMIALIQCFPDRSGTGFADHRRKILALKTTPIWLKCRGKIFLQGWKPPLRGTRSWRMREEEIKLGD
jgi:hypothetical protein